MTEIYCVDGVCPRQKAVNACMGAVVPRRKAGNAYLGAVISKAKGALRAPSLKRVRLSPRYRLLWFVACHRFCFRQWQNGQKQMA